MRHIISFGIGLTVTVVVCLLIYFIMVHTASFLFIVGCMILMFILGKMVMLIYKLGNEIYKVIFDEKD